MRRYLVLSLSVLALGACETKPKLEDAQYWQRIESSSALHLQGPKAQQTLHQDIARCVAQVNELEKLGSIREGVPADLEKPDDSELAKWDTPQKDGYLGADHLDFTDFETCMRDGGWERVEHLPYDVADRARNTWIKTIIGEKKTEKGGNVKAASSSEGGGSGLRSGSDRDPFKDLNE